MGFSTTEKPRFPFTRTTYITTLVAKDFSTQLWQPPARADIQPHRQADKEGKGQEVLDGLEGEEALALLECLLLL